MGDVQARQSVSEVVVVVVAKDCQSQQNGVCFPWYVGAIHCAPTLVHGRNEFAPLHVGTTRDFSDVKALFTETERGVINFKIC